MIPLLDLANKGICTKSNKVIPKFEWKHEHNEAFMKIKEMIQNHIVNNIPEIDKDFYLEAESSSQAVGCRLTQKDEFGNEIPIASSSRILTKSERSYSIHKKEALSVLYALKSLDIFLNGSRIHLKCDAKSLIFIKCSRGSSEILARFALTLSSYCISVEHVNGKNNVQADAYSRSRSNDSEIDELPQMTESEAAIILDLITLPKNFYLNQNEMKSLMESTPLPSIVKKTLRNKSTRTKKISQKSMLPPEKPKRKSRPLQIVKIHPYYKNHPTSFILMSQ